MHTAALMDRYGAGARAITRHNYLEVGQPCVYTVTLDQLGNVQSATSLAPGTRYLQHGQPAGDM